MSCLKWAISQDFLGAFLLRPDAPFLPTAVSGFKKTFLYHLCQDAPTHSWHYFDILNLVYISQIWQNKTDHPSFERLLL